MFHVWIIIVQYYLVAISSYFLGLIYWDEMLLIQLDMMNISDLQIPARNYKLGKLCIFLLLIHCSSFPGGPHT